MDVKKATVVGAGVMGHGIAIVLAQAGCQVTMMDLAPQLLERAHARIRASLDAFVRHGLASRQKADGLLKRIGATTDLAEAVRDTDFVIEAVTEDVDIKRKVFGQLDALCPSRTILASNTSSLPIVRMASATRRPDRVVGTHFVMPPHIMPLVEVVRGEASSDASVKTAYDLMLKAGMRPIIVNKDVPGFVHNRLQAAVTREAVAMVQAGIASAEDVDLVVTHGFGLRYAANGPLKQRDLAGINTHYMVAKYLYPDLDASKEPLPYMKKLVDSGHLGVKTGRGFYDWGGQDPEAVLKAQEEELIEAVKALRQREAQR